MDQARKTVRSMTKKMQFKYRKNSQQGHKIQNGVFDLKLISRSHSLNDCHSEQMHLMNSLLSEPFLYHLKTHLRLHRPAPCIPVLKIMIIFIPPAIIIVLPTIAFWTPFKIIYREYLWAIRYTEQCGTS